MAASGRSFTDQLPPGYTLNMEFKRITTNPRQMGGVPCLRGFRIPVATVVALVAEGQTTEGILALYPDLEADDVREALRFAAEAVRERALPLAAGEALKFVPADQLRPVFFLDRGTSIAEIVPLREPM